MFGHVHVHKGTNVAKINGIGFHGMHGRNKFLDRDALCFGRIQALERVILKSSLMASPAVSKQS